MIKKTLWEQARGKYRNLYEEKNKKREYRKNISDNMADEKKQVCNSEPVYNDKYIKTKIKICNNRVYTNFQNNEIPKDHEYCTCLSVISLDSIFVKSDTEFYPKLFLEECKYMLKDMKIIITINKNLELSECD